MGRPISGEVITFSGLHRRLYRERGRAASLQCVDCGRQAREWSYSHRDPDEVTHTVRGRAVPYSLDLHQYDPRCAACHHSFDRFVTAGRNQNSGKTHCKHGHLFSEENTYYRPSGSRVCKECSRIRNRRWKERAQ